MLSKKLHSEFITLVSDQSNILYTKRVMQILDVSLQSESEINQTTSKKPYLVRVSGNRIQLEYLKNKRKPFVPMISPGFQAKGGDPLLRAIGIKQGTVIDMTAGWCVDASRIACSGCNIIAFENNPLVYVLTQNAIEHCQSPLIKQRLDLRHADSIQALQSNAIDADVIYMDPMFPSYKRDAASPKPITLLRDLVDHTQDMHSFDRMFELAMNSNVRRVIIKRPHHQPAIERGKVGEIKSKQIRYDLYYPRQ
ncbi:MAG: class I SAM-dependent methyltransferase [Gammaproteobacteria bacterium]|nr:class I SAM-dependent methyltransferase [Gammaproteobacteria bacterium]MCY4275512.1 class I SAM-dependent methyltransferase [Gammaproteobacteria bacterium]